MQFLVSCVIAQALTHFHSPYPHCLSRTQAGSELAAEKAQFESRLRRIKLACSRWKVAYQRDVHERYQQMASVLEERYMRCAYFRTLV
jgi:hypothetical protein